MTWGQSASVASLLAVCCLCPGLRLEAGTLEKKIKTRLVERAELTKLFGERAEPTVCPRAHPAGT